jgi:uncharacterized protein YbjT (DUF2867 family)
MQRKLITCFGATGNQGGSIINALLPAGYDVRAVTRDPEDRTCEDLKSLRARGVEIVKGDISKDSMEDLAKLMKGSYGAFLMTNFWDPSSMNKEVEQGHKLVDAAKRAGVKHIIWSTLPNVEKLSKNKYNVSHFTDKAKVEEYIRSLQQKSQKAFEHVTFIAPAFYFQNFKTLLPPKKEGDTWVFTMPETKYLTAFDVNQTGPAVLTAFNNPRDWDLRRIDYCGEHSAPQAYIDTFSRVTGLKARLNMKPMKEFAKMNIPHAEELANMFGWFNEFDYFGPEGELKSGQSATPGGLYSWETFLRRYGWTTETA